MRKKLRKKDLPEIIFFEEKVGSNGIHCLDYKSSSNIKYIREDVVKNISSNPMLADRLPNAEDVKMWYQLLVGKSEEAMQKDIEATLR